MTQVQQTSLEAYRDIQHALGRRQAQVLNVFLNYPSYNYTNTEISRVLKLPINQITPRVYELRRKGLLVEATRRACNVTGRTCIAWRLNAPMEV
jgi:DNA-binding MarR family transcriptional regulator